MKDRIDSLLSALAEHPYAYAEAVQECPHLEALLVDCGDRIDDRAEGLADYLASDMAERDALSLACALDLARKHLYAAIENCRNETGMTYAYMLDHDDMLDGIVASRDERRAANAYLERRICEDAESCAICDATDCALVYSIERASGRVS